MTAATVQQGVAAENHRGGSPTYPAVYIRHERFDAISEAECVGLTTNDTGLRGGWIVTANLDHLRRLVKDAGYRDLCRGASLMVADGMPLVWASRLQGTPLPERVAGSNLIFSLSAAAAGEGRSVYLLGGDPGTAEEAGRILAERYPGLRIAGARCPPMGFEQNAEEMAAIERALRTASPDIVFVALGSPKQERLIAGMREKLPGAWWIGVGISFSFVCGRVRRAPRWMQKCGLEWLHRLIQEPRRLAKRYLVDDLPFAAHLFASAAWRRFRGSGRSDELNDRAAEVEAAASSLPRREIAGPPVGPKQGLNGRHAR